MDDLKDKARPKHNELVAQLKELNAKQETNIILLDRLCDLKEMQQENDNEFRDSWAILKRRDSKITHLLLLIASITFSLDLVQFEDKVIILERINSYFEMIKGAF